MSTCARRKPPASMPPLDPKRDMLNTEKSTDLLAGLAHPDVDCLFRRSPRSGMPSAWHGHVPFAYWIVATARPRSLVELGTHNGVSYAAFCDAVVCQQLD